MKNSWTEEDVALIEELYKDGFTAREISDKMNKPLGSVKYKVIDLKLGDKYMRSNNTKFKAIYQDYNWCYQHYIVNGEDMDYMAKIAGTTKRTIQKWCSEKYHLNKDTFRHIKNLSPIQKELIMFGRLGDGHIDRRPDQPMYIESHAENRKEYLFWKWEILKDICNTPPVYYKPIEKIFNGKAYLTQAYYRLNTRIIDALSPIREMSITDIIARMNEFGLSLHLLDDGSRDYSRWTVCVASFSTENKILYVNVCRRLGFNARILTDDRYIGFDSISSRKIDNVIIKYIPSTIDIVKNKILNNVTATDGHYIYVITQTGRIGLNSFCRSNGLNYLKCRDYIRGLGIREISEIKLLNGDF